MRTLVTARPPARITRDQFALAKRISRDELDAAVAAGLVRFDADDTISREEFELVGRTFDDFIVRSRRKSRQAQQPQSLSDRDPRRAYLTIAACAAELSRSARREVRAATIKKLVESGELPTKSDEFGTPGIDTLSLTRIMRDKNLWPRIWAMQSEADTAERAAARDRANLERELSAAGLSETEVEAVVRYVSAGKTEEQRERRAREALSRARGQEPKSDDTGSDQPPNDPQRADKLDALHKQKEDLRQKLLRDGTNPRYLSELRKINLELKRLSTPEVAR